MIDETLLQDATSLLEQASKSKEWHVKFAACEAFAHLNANKNNKIWQKALEHTSSFVRDRAVIAIGKIGNSRWLSSLEKLKEDIDPLVRGHLLETLIAIAPEKTSTYLYSCLKDKNDFVKKIAVESLDFLETTDSIATLESIANGNEEFVDFAYPLILMAAYCLAKRKNKVGISVLEETLYCGDIWLEFTAAKKLLSLGNKKGIPQIEAVLVRGDWNLKLEALTALLQAKENINTIDLLKPVEAPDIQTQITTAIVLYSLQPEISEEIVKMALQLNEDELQIHTIQNIVLHQHVHLLHYAQDIALLGKEHVKASLVVALEKIAHKDFLPLLKPIFYHAHWLLKIQTARAILKIKQTL